MLESDLPVARLAALYDFGSWQSVELLAMATNDHFLVKTDAGPMAVRRSRPNKTASGLRFEHELIAHLRTKGIPAPRVVPTIEGATFATSGDRLFTVTKFEPGVRWDRRSSRQIEAVGRLIGHYHQATMDFSPSLPPPLEPDLPRRLRTRLRRLSSANAGSPSVPGQIVRSAHEALAILEPLYPSLPRTSIWAGCRQGSVLFDGDEVVAAFDFDGVHPEARLTDPIVALLHFVPMRSTRAGAIGLFNKLLAGYEAEVPLTNIERQALLPLLEVKLITKSLGRYERLLRGTSRATADLRRLPKEERSLRWIEDNRSSLATVLSSP